MVEMHVTITNLDGFTDGKAYPVFEVSSGYNTLLTHDDTASLRWVQMDYCTVHQFVTAKPNGGSCEPIWVGPEKPI